MHIRHLGSLYLGSGALLSVRSKTHYHGITRTRCNKETLGREDEEDSTLVYVDHLPSQRQSIGCRGHVFGPPLGPSYSRELRPSFSLRQPVRHRSRARVPYTLCFSDESRCRPLEGRVSSMDLLAGFTITSQTVRC